jgi:antitoxin (DNA-binding transcriptional repressor) of toxin-antitoxin stability system
MKDLSATEVARRLSEVLDSVEHRKESFRVIRAGRAVARITPVGRANGREVVDFLSGHRPDSKWAEDLESVRALLQSEDRDWQD